MLQVAAYCRERLWATCVMALGNMYVPTGTRTKEAGIKACGMAKAWPPLPEGLCMRAASHMTMPAGVYCSTWICSVTLIVQQHLRFVQNCLPSHQQPS